MVFLARGQHLRAMQNKGLLLESAGKQAVFAVHASDDVQQLENCDVILLCCKTTQLDAMCQALSAVVKADAVWLTLQNGVQAVDQVHAYFPEHTVLAGSAFIGVRIEQAGYVIHSAAGHIRLGNGYGNGDDVLYALHAAWQQIGVDAQIEADMRSMLWKKMLWNCGFNAITALTRRYARDVAADVAMAAWVRAAMLEVMAVAKVVGVEIDRQVMEQHMHLTMQAGPVKTSMWQDISHQKQTEIAAMNGYIAAQGEKHGIDVPVNRMLADMISVAEGAYLEG